MVYNMLLIKKLGIALCILSTAVFSVGCFAQSDKPNIDFTAKYNSTEKCVDVTITNNTKNQLVSYDTQHKIYQQNNDEFKNVTPSYASVATATNLMPFDNNSETLSFSTYDTSDVKNITDSKNTTALTSGTYKVTMDVNVYDNVEYFTSPYLTDGTTFPQLDNATCKTVTLEAMFTID